MSNIKIHFTRNKKGKIFSKAIQWYDGIPISHCCIEISTKYGPFIYHSNFQNGVSLIPKFKFSLDNEIMETYEFTMSSDDFESIRGEFLLSLGESYAFLQNLGIVIVDFFRRNCINITNPWKDGQNCSELVYRSLIPYVCKDFSGYEPDLIKPSQIRKILILNNNKPIFSKL